MTFMEKAVKTAKKVRGVPFVKGDPRINLEGRPLGSRDFSTDFDEVVDDIAKENKIPKSEVRKVLLKVAYKQAKDGSYPFWKDIHDRVYGSATQKTDITTKGESVNLENREKILAFTKQVVEKIKEDAIKKRK